MWRTSVCICLVMAFGEARAEQYLARQQPLYVNGKVIRINPDQGSVVIRVASGGIKSDLEFEIGNTTRFWGQQRYFSQSGLYFLNVAEGIAVWYERGSGQASSTVTELRLIQPNPALAPPGETR